MVGCSKRYEIFECVIVKNDLIPRAIHQLDLANI